MSPRSGIIAVFGSKQANYQSLAKSIGAEIARKKHFVLTGGKVPTGGNQAVVRVSAINGAKEERGRWIGVGKLTKTRGRTKKEQHNPDKTRSPECQKSDDSFEFYTNLGEHRNYLEACLCDAAIAIRGGEGTSSEVVFCLALEKPVVLIGDWPTDDQNALHVNNLVDEASLRVLPNNGDRRSWNPYDELEKQIQNSLKLQPPLSQYRILSLSVDAKEAVEHIIADLGKSNAKGSFPDLGSEFNNHYKKVKDSYEKWLAKPWPAEQPA